MTIAPATSSKSEPSLPRATPELGSTALAATAATSEDPRLGSLVIVVHPEHDDHRVVASVGADILRASVAVAVASGNNRLWADAPTNDTIEHPVRALPEVVRASAEAGQVVATHTGAVRVDGRIEAVAIWFDSGTGIAPADDRRTTLELLRVAAERDHERIGEDVPPAQQSDNASDERHFDATDPDLDATTGLANRRSFECALEHYESDRATLILIEIDHFDQLVELHGDEVADRVLLATADRLLRNCRKSDLVARLDCSIFAVLFGDADRSTALQISKRILSELAEPLPIEPGPAAVTATVALAHQFGLVDTDELMQSANSALLSGRRAGGGRLFLAS